MMNPTESETKVEKIFMHILIIHFECNNNIENWMEIKNHCDHEKL